MKYILLLVAIISVASCVRQPTNETGEKNKTISVKVDSLNALFVSGWNNKDSAAIMSTMAADAVVMNDSLIHTGKEAIAKDWISGGVKVLSNVKTTSAISDISDKLAFDAGTYTLDLTIPNGPVLKERGNYSLVWTQQPDNQWLLTLVHIEDVTRLPDIQ